MVVAFVMLSTTSSLIRAATKRQASEENSMWLIGMCEGNEKQTFLTSCSHIIVPNAHRLSDKVLHDNASGTGLDKTGSCFSILPSLLLTLCSQPPQYRLICNSIPGNDAAASNSKRLERSLTPDFQASFQGRSITCCVKVELYQLIQ